MAAGLCPAPRRAHARTWRRASRMGGYILSKALPLMILLMVLLGAFYPAIDVTAGERERGTLETVLAAPMPAAGSAAGQGAGGDRAGQRIGLPEPRFDEPDPGPGGEPGRARGRPARALDARRGHRAGGAAHGLPAGRRCSWRWARWPAASRRRRTSWCRSTSCSSRRRCWGRWASCRSAPGLALVPGLNVSLLARDIALGKADAGATALVLGSTLLWGLLALVVAARFYVSERFLAVGDRRARAARKQPGTATGVRAGPAALGGRGAGRCSPSGFLLAVLRVHAAAAAAPGARAC